MTNTLCPICYDPINQYGCILLIKCGHMICISCWKNFIENHKNTHTMRQLKCPSCRCVIHLSSVLYGERLKYVKDNMERNIKNENEYLRSQLKLLSTSNRKEMGQWKWYYNEFIKKSTILLKQYNNERNGIEHAYLCEMLIFRTDMTRFNSHFNAMRDALKKMTKKYIESPKRKDPMPPDPTDIIPQDIHNNASLPLHISLIPSQGDLPNIANRAFMIGPISTGLSINNIRSPPPSPLL